MGPGPKRPQASTPPSFQTEQRCVSRLASMPGVPSGWSRIDVAAPNAAWHAQRSTTQHALLTPDNGHCMLDHRAESGLPSGNLLVCYGIDGQLVQWFFHWNLNFHRIFQLTMFPKPSLSFDWDRYVQSSSDRPRFQLCQSMGNCLGEKDLDSLLVQSCSSPIFVAYLNLSSWISPCFG